MDKLKNLRGYLRGLGKVAIAFSGGVDSTLLARVAHEELGDDAIAITINAEIHANWEIDEAKEFSKSIGIRHHIEPLSVLDMEAFSNHPVDRCYHCKKAVFSRIFSIAASYGITTVIDGSNVDDLSDYRPGLKAINELGVISPLKAVGLTKDEIRSISASLELPTSQKPAFACLATRVPFGEAVTSERLVRIEKSELVLMQAGIKQFRVRDHGDIARIEVSKEDLHLFIEDAFLDKVVEALKSFGYDYVTLDLAGYTMGSMNKLGDEDGREEV